MWFSLVGRSIPTCTSGTRNFHGVQFRDLDCFFFLCSLSQVGTFNTFGSFWNMQAFFCSSFGLNFACPKWPNWILHVPLLVWILFIKINWRDEWRWPLQRRKLPSLEISTLPIFVVLNMIGFLLTGLWHGRYIWFCDFDTCWQPIWFIVCQGRMDFSSIKNTDGLQTCGILTHQPLMHWSIQLFWSLKCSERLCTWQVHEQIFRTLAIQWICKEIMNWANWTCSYFTRSCTGISCCEKLLWYLVRKL